MDEKDIAAESIRAVVGGGGGYLLTQAADGLFGKDITAFFETLKKPI